MRRIIALAALALSGAAAGCQTPMPPQVDARIDARGTEPFWAVRVRDAQVTLIRPEQPDLSAPAQRRTEGGASVWSGRTADGRTLTLRVWPQACSDGMSDLAYPMAAEVSLTGREVLKGCAAPARG
ncbi:COG3650 family protein [Phenylobacterium deserti]|uniref:Uncharacterized protein n=1 Tax=Phenylobacterium deserti TaxID=1914756 RepID=A0A328ARG8_9CAUL|nr:hypothetical protein [Phenylobacterium deserti]RAK57139.1 hypothetical protein DJ018_04060 [Phenylobacterium deserti]